MLYQPHPRENVYYYLRVAVTVALYLSLIVAVRRESISLASALRYAMYFAIFFIMRKGLLIGGLKNNAIRVTEKQFPEVLAYTKLHSLALDLGKVPSVYVVQSGGILNAFATRFLGSDYIVINSDVLETAYEKGSKAVEFIVAHELGHIKRRHCAKNLFLFPTFVIPFLNSAYSRACEYTCDRIGLALCPEGAIPGMLILAAGKRLRHQVDAVEYVSQANIGQGFWTWMAEIVSTHPPIPKRIAAMAAVAPAVPFATEEQAEVSPASAA